MLSFVGVESTRDFVKKLLFFEFIFFIIYIFVWIVRCCSCRAEKNANTSEQIKQMVKREDTWAEAQELAPRLFRNIGRNVKTCLAYLFIAIVAYKIMCEGRSFKLPLLDLDSLLGWGRTTSTDLKTEV